MRKWIYVNGERTPNPDWTKLETVYQEGLKKLKRLIKSSEWKEDKTYPKGGYIVDYPTEEYSRYKRKWRELLTSDEEREARSKPNV